MKPSVLAGHSWSVGVDDGVAALDVSGRGAVAVAGSDGTLILLSADGVVELSQTVSAGCLAVEWSPSGDRLAVGSVDGVVILRGSGDVVASVPGGWCSSVAWSDDGTRLAAGIGRDVTILDAEGAEISRRERDSTVTAVAWVNRRLASAAYGGLHVHHAAKTAPPDVMPFVGSLLAMAISPDRRWAASGNQDATLHVWRIGRDSDHLAMAGYPRKITAVGFSPDSTMLASGGGSDVTVWDFAGHGPRGTTPRILQGYGGAVTALSWSADGRLLAAADSTGHVSVWNPRAAQPGRPTAPLDSIERSAAATVVCWDLLGRLLAGWSDGSVAAHVVAEA